MKRSPKRLEKINSLILNIRNQKVMLDKDLAELSHEELYRKINELETKYDAKFSFVFKALKQLIDQPNPPRRQIGFIKKE